MKPGDLYKCFPKRSRVVFIEKYPITLNLKNYAVEKNDIVLILKKTTWNTCVKDSLPEDKWEELLSVGDNLFPGGVALHKKQTIFLHEDELNHFIKLN